MTSMDEMIDRYRSGPNEEVLALALKEAIESIDDIFGNADLTPSGMRVVLEMKTRIMVILEDK